MEEESDEERDEEMDEHDDEEDDDEDEEHDEHDDEGGAGAGGPFGIDLRAMAGFMSGLSGRFKGILASLKNRTDPSIQLAALQELSEVLSISSEDSLAGYFPTESFVTELASILRGHASAAGHMDDMDDDMASALAAAAIADQEDSSERMLLAARCMANLIEAMPYSAHSIVAHDAVPLLVAKLQAIDFIDLAEQVLQVSRVAHVNPRGWLGLTIQAQQQTLEKISGEFPSAIVRAGGLAAMLQYLDFFNIHTQRTAMTAVANCCRRLPTEHFTAVRDAVRPIKDVLGSPDLRLREAAGRSIVGIIDSFKSAPSQLAQLITRELCDAIKLVLERGTSGGSSSQSVGATVITDLLRNLATASKAAPQVTGHLLDNKIAETLLAILVGVAPAEKPQDGSAEAARRRRSSDANAVNKMALLQNLADRPKEQIQETLSLISELLPPLPQEGIFDKNRYTLHAGPKDAKKEPRESKSDTSSAESSTTKTAPNVASSATSRKKHDATKTPDALSKLRTSMLSDRRASLLELYAVVLPALIDIHTSSVTPSIRSKAMLSILKIMASADPSELDTLLDDVPMSSFVAGILSGNNDQATLLGSLEIVELLLTKKPEIYRSLLQREGVMWEVRQLAKQSSKTHTQTTGEAADTSAGTSQASSPTKAGPSTSPAGSRPSSVRHQIIARARHIYSTFSKGSKSDQDAGGDSDSLTKARSLAKKLGDALANQSDTSTVLQEVFALMHPSAGGISSFELLKSGLLAALLSATATERNDAYGTRCSEAFAKAADDDRDAIASLVERLQEVLSRHEDFDIVTLGSSVGSDDRKSRASVLSRQLRLRLVADTGTDVPASCNNLIVSIHAVAPFKSLYDFLRPKLSLSSMTGSNVSSKLSSVLAALAEASGSHDRDDANAGSVLSGASVKAKLEEQEGSGAGETAGGDDAARSRTLAEALMEDLLRDEFDTFDEQEEDLEVIERSISPPGDQTDADSSPKKESPAKQSTSSPVANSTRAKSGRASYADAAQKNGKDWRIAFFVGGREVDLSETIFRAIYQQEKGTSASFSPTSLFWQNVHTVKFKKVDGKPPSGNGKLAACKTMLANYSDRFEPCRPNRLPPSA